MSLDYLSTSDFEMGGNVLGEIDMVRELIFFSDKCTLKELEKLEDEFAKDLKKLRFKTRVSIWKYIKDVDTSGGKDKEKDGEEGSLKGPTLEAVHDNVVSQNPKINYKIAEGFAKQIQSNPLLQ